MSEVWRAHDETLDRTVALKMLSPTADLDRFRREGQALAALTHENIMRVYDYGEDEAGPFMALEWLSGGTLEERLREGPLTDGETRGVAERIAAGLAHLHARGLVHRDLKPANVLFGEEGRPKLGDFGLARRTAGAGTLTEAGTVMGTAAYLSPEQAGGETAGPESDVYSFGVILFRMLTGALPFVADEPLALMNMHRHATPPTVEELRPDAPQDLAALTSAALSKDPASRPADGNALLAALGEAPTIQIAPAETAVTRVISAADAPPPEPPPGPPRRPFWREPAAIAAAVVLLALGGGLLAWAVTRSDTSAPAATTSKPGHTKSRPATTETPTTHSQATETQPPTTTSAPITTTAPTTTQAPPTTSTPTTAPTTTAPTTTAPTTTTASGTTATTTTT
jgi:serine/threonine-protein kinase